LIDNTVDFLNSHFLSHDIEVIRDYPNHDDVVVHADANRLRQALLNILLNAVEAIDKDGQLRISLRKKEEDKVNIIIEDNGPGISPKDIRHIFDPFYTTKDHGSGLGLSITQRIIHDHNGKIFVKSEINKGTIFILELPSKEKVRS
jgi:signal transduction histidine kinase